MTKEKKTDVVGKPYATAPDSVFHVAELKAAIELKNARMRAKTQAKINREGYDESKN